MARQPATSATAANLTGAALDTDHHGAIAPLRVATLVTPDHAADGVTARQEPWGLVGMWIEDPDGVRNVLVEVPDGHPLRRDQR